MKIALDTSVVLRLLTGAPRDESERARARLVAAQAAGDEVLVTDLVAAEAFHVLRFHYEVPRDEAAEAIRRMVTSGVVRFDPPEALRAWTGKSAVRLVDRLVQARHASLDAVTWTFDRRQARLDGVTRL